MTQVNYLALGPSRARSGEDPVVPFLLGARNAPATISARDVTRLDSHRLQILLVAKRQWERDGQAFELTDMTPTFRQGLERLGLAQDHFDKEPAK